MSVTPSIPHSLNVRDSLYTSFSLSLEVEREGRAMSVTPSIEVEREGSAMSVTPSIPHSLSPSLYPNTCVSACLETKE